jgi:hypothetical protein
MLIVGLHGPSILVSKLNADKTVVFGGQPNRLSEEQETYPLIERIHSATKLSTESTIPSLGAPKVSGRGQVSLPPPVSTNHGFGAIVRTRRSALDFKGGRESISFPQLATLLSATRERLFADFATHRYVHLYLYVHRVEGLEPGVCLSLLAGACRVGKNQTRGPTPGGGSPQFGTRPGGKCLRGIFHDRRF